MSKCGHCGRETTSGDFCDHCGNYLRWAPSGEFEALARRREPPAKSVTQPTSPMRMQRIRGRDLRAAKTQVQTAAQPVGEVRLSLRAAEDDERSGRLAPRVVPGDSVEIIARIHNRTDRVDHFRIVVSQLPDDWWSVDPGTVFLNPYGARGRHEQEVRIRFHPPRTPGAAARAWPVTVSVISDDRRAEVASAQLALEIAPYEELRAQMRPTRRTGYRRGRFSVAFTNDGNAPADLALTGRDEEDACRMTLGRPQLTVPSGETAVCPLTVRPTGRHWIGRPVDHRFSITYGPAGKPAEPQRMDGTFRRRPWLPWWLTLLVPIAIAAVIAALILRPHHTRVPDLTNVKSPFLAQKLLSAAGLKLQPSPKPRVVDGVPPGTIVDQDPKPGTEVDKGSVVTVEQAAGSEERTVPSVVGMTPADADRQLRKDGLSLGSVQPQDGDLNSPIVSQLPPPETPVKVGTAVNVSVAANATPGPVVVPDGTESATPTPTPTATPAVSELIAGVLAYDDGTKVMIWDTQGVRPLAESGIQPAWTADGKGLAYVREADGRSDIVQIDPAAGAGSAVVLTDGKGRYRRPAFSPAGGLLAYIDERDDKDRLCLQPADGAEHAPSCLKSDGWHFARRPAWSPDGQTLVAIATKGGTTGLFGFKADGTTWKSLGLLAKLKGINSVAWAPNGKALAVMADDGEGHHLRLLDVAQDGKLGDPRPLQTLGCEVVWRLDGRLAISQYSCGQRKAVAGAIVVVDPSAPASPAPLPEVVGVNPDWQPQAAG